MDIIQIGWKVSCLMYKMLQLGSHLPSHLPTALMSNVAHTSLEVSVLYKILF